MRPWATSVPVLTDYYCAPSSWTILFTYLRESERESERARGREGDGLLCPALLDYSYTYLRRQRERPGVYLYISERQTETEREREREKESFANLDYSCNSFLMILSFSHSPITPSLPSSSCVCMCMCVCRSFFLLVKLNGCRARVAFLEIGVCDSIRCVCARAFVCPTNTLMSTSVSFVAPANMGGQKTRMGEKDTTLRPKPPPPKTGVTISCCFTTTKEAKDWTCAILILIWRHGGRKDRQDG